MRLVCFTRPDPALETALVAEGFELDVRELARPREASATTALAAALRDAERALIETPAAAVLVAGDGEESLGVALAAVKLGVPTALSGTASDRPLVARVADLALDATADAGERARAVRQLAEPKLPSA